MRYHTENTFKTADGAELWYGVYGDGESTLVMNDGLGCDGFAWKHLLRLLSPTHRILRWHYRGHGQSTLPTDSTRLGIRYFAEDLAALMDHVGFGPSIVAGHSMGVQVGFEFHRLFPERVRALVPVCGSYGHPLETFHDHDKATYVFPIVHALAERFPEVFRLGARKILATEFAYQIALYTEVNRHFVKREDFFPYFEHLAFKIDPVIFLRTAKSAADHTAWDHLPNVKVPTLIVAGERDRFTPMWLSQRMHSRIPGSELLIVPTGSHTAPIEMPELIALRMEKFFAEHLGQAAVMRKAAGE